MTKKWYWIAFLAGIAIRIAFIPWSESHYSAELFLPFLDASLLHGDVNPWQLQAPGSFPYGSTLYVLEIVPKIFGHWLFGPAALGVHPLSLTLLKLPVFCCDLLLFQLLLRRFPGEIFRLMAFYWFNPVLIYVNYVLGQLDLIPMTFVIVSCFALVSNRLVLSGIFAAAAITSKFHAALALPLFLLYVWRNDFFPQVLKKLAIWATSFAVVLVLGFIMPYQAGRLGYITLGSPEAQRLFSLSINMGGDQNLHLGLALVLAVMGRILLTKQISEQGLFFGMGILYTALFLITRPMPSWVLWFLPFVSVFVAHYRLIHVGLPLLFVGVYFSYFVFIPRFFADNALMSSLAFTLMQCCVAAFLFLIWYLLGRREFPLSARLRPIIIGIAGDSGAGKNRLSEALAKIFDVSKGSQVEGDDYHRWERGHESWNHLSHLSPKANSLDVLSHHTSALSSGRSVLHPHYDHGTGHFTVPRRAKPNQTIIVQGLHTLYPRSMRSAMDLKVFVRPDPLVRLSWKIQRDVKERGHTLDRIVASMQRRESDSHRYIEPQRMFADWIIEAMPDENLDEQMILEGFQPRLKMRHVLWNDGMVLQLVDTLAELPGLGISSQPVEDDIDRIAVTIAGDISHTDVARIAHKIFPFLRSLTRSPNRPTWLGGFDGINQLIALCLTSQKNMEIAGK